MPMRDIEIIKNTYILIQKKKNNKWNSVITFIKNVILKKNKNIIVNSALPVVLSERLAQVKNQAVNLTRLALDLNKDPVLVTEKTNEFVIELSKITKEREVLDDFVQNHPTQSRTLLHPIVKAYNHQNQLNNRSIVSPFAEDAFKPVLLNAEYLKTISQMKIAHTLQNGDKELIQEAIDLLSNLKGNWCTTSFFNDEIIKNFVLQNHLIFWYMHNRGMLATSKEILILYKHHLYRLTNDPAVLAKIDESLKDEKLLRLFNKKVFDSFWSTLVMNEPIPLPQKPILFPNENMNKEITISENIPVRIERYLNLSNPVYKIADDINQMSKSQLLRYSNEFLYDMNKFKEKKLDYTFLDIHNNIITDKPRVTFFTDLLNGKFL